MTTATASRRNLSHVMLRSLIESGEVDAYLLRDAYLQAIVHAPDDAHEQRVYIIARVGFASEYLTAADALDRAEKGE